MRGGKDSNEVILKGSNRPFCRVRTMVIGGDKINVKMMREGAKIAFQSPLRFIVGDGSCDSMPKPFKKKLKASL